MRASRTARGALCADGGVSQSGRGSGDNKSRRVVGDHHHTRRLFCFITDMRTPPEGARRRFASQISSPPLVGVRRGFLNRLLFRTYHNAAFRQALLSAHFPNPNAARFARLFPRARVFRRAESAAEQSCGCRRMKRGLLRKPRCAPLTPQSARLKAARKSRSAPHKQETCPCAR